MNIFEIIFLDGILLTFPILAFLIYLFTNKNIKERLKKIYESLMLITSFFLTLKYGVNNPIIIPILILNTIIVLSYIKNKYILANIFCLLIIFRYYFIFKSMHVLVIGYIICFIIYILKNKLKMKNILFISLLSLVNSIFYYIWIYAYNNTYYNFKNINLIIISYIFLVHIVFIIYKSSKEILQTHMTFKNLQQEKQIRLSLFKITHEIKNPIAVCKGYLDMLNVNDQKKVSKYIPIIKSEIERLLSLLQDFLLINKNNMDLDIMDLNLLVEDTLSKVNPILNGKDINISLDLIDDEIFINGDYNRLSQVLINILKNSIEAIKDSGVISISSEIKNNKYILTIKDNGIGMNEDVLRKIKEPFYTTKRRGSGLGVSLIYEIIEAHNGSVEYYSKYGFGTKVIIKMPLYN